MSFRPPSTPFPINALPLKARNSALELQRNTGAPLGLIAVSTLAAMSLVIQGLVDVKRMDGLIGPVSAWYLIIAASGERKTAIDAKNMQPIREFDRDQDARYKTEIAKYKAKLFIWDADYQRVATLIKKFAAQGKSSDDLKEILMDHATKRPKKPRLVRLLYSDTTPAATKKAFGKNWNSIGLVSSEGASMLTGQAMGDLSFLNSAWDGSTIQVDRANEESITIEDPRLTVSVMIQPRAARRYFDRKGEERRDLGNDARYFMAEPETTQGTRFISGFPISWECLDIFQKEIRKLAEQNVNHDGDPVKRKTLSFTPQAQARWIDFANFVENNMNFGGMFYFVREYAAKIADNVARLAATFHRFDSEEEHISVTTLENAITVSDWFFNEFRRLFSPEYQIPQQQQDAYCLEKWMAQWAVKGGDLVFFQCTKILQYGPVSLRNKNRLNMALDFLLKQGAIEFFYQKKTRCVKMNPNYFTPTKISFLCYQGGWA